MKNLRNGKTLYQYFLTHGLEKTKEKYRHLVYSNKVNEQLTYLHFLEQIIHHNSAYDPVVDLHLSFDKTKIEKSIINLCQKLYKEDPTDYLIQERYAHSLNLQKKYSLLKNLIEQNSKNILLKSYTLTLKLATLQNLITKKELEKSLKFIFNNLNTDNKTIIISSFFPKIKNLILSKITQVNKTSDIIDILEIKKTYSQIITQIDPNFNQNFYSILSEKLINNNNPFLWNYFEQEKDLTQLLNFLKDKKNLPPTFINSFIKKKDLIIPLIKNNKTLSQLYLEVFSKIKSENEIIDLNINKSFIDFFLNNYQETENTSLPKKEFYKNIILPTIIKEAIQDKDETTFTNNKKLSSLLDYLTENPGKDKIAIQDKLLKKQTQIINNIKDDTNLSSKYLQTFTKTFKDTPNEKLDIDENFVDFINDNLEKNNNPQIKEFYEDKILNQVIKKTTNKLSWKNFLKKKENFSSLLDYLDKNTKQTGDDFKNDFLNQKDQVIPQIKEDDQLSSKYLQTFTKTFKDTPNEKLDIDENFVDFINDNLEKNNNPQIKEFYENKILNQVIKKTTNKLSWKSFLKKKENFSSLLDYLDKNTKQTGDDFKNDFLNQKDQVISQIKKDDQLSSKYLQTFTKTFKDTPNEKLDIDENFVDFINDNLEKNNNPQIKEFYENKILKWILKKDIPGLSWEFFLTDITKLSFFLNFLSDNIKEVNTPFTQDFLSKKDQIIAIIKNDKLLISIYLEIFTKLFKDKTLEEIQLNKTFLEFYLNYLDKNYDKNLEDFYHKIILNNLIKKVPESLSWKFFLTKESRFSFFLEYLNKNISETEHPFIIDFFENKEKIIEKFKDNLSIITKFLDVFIKLSKTITPEELTLNNFFLNFFIKHLESNSNLNYLLFLKDNLLKNTSNKPIIKNALEVIQKNFWIIKNDSSLINFYFNLLKNFFEEKEYIDKTLEIINNGDLPADWSLLNKISIKINKLIEIIRDNNTENNLTDINKKFSEIFENNYDWLKNNFETFFAYLNIAEINGEKEKLYNSLKKEKIDPNKYITEHYPKSSFRILITFINEKTIHHDFDNLQILSEFLNKKYPEKIETYFANINIYIQTGKTKEKIKKLVKAAYKKFPNNNQLVTKYLHYLDKEELENRGFNILQKNLIEHPDNKDALAWFLEDSLNK